MSRAFRSKRPLGFARLRLRLQWLREWLTKENEPLTLLLMTKGHLEVQKLHIQPKWVKVFKYGVVSLCALFAISLVFLFYFLATLPIKFQMERENLALKTELNKVQFHLDNLQTTVDRVSRFNQKLRALTDVDKEFAKDRGPLAGQGGADDEFDQQIFDFGDFEVKQADLALDDNAPEILNRRDRFIVQKLFSWMTRLYQDTELETQSVEELYEVLKGRKLQLAATPSIIPVRGWITSNFGYRLDPFTGRRAFHKGMDVAAREGTSIVSPAEGVVSFAGPYGSYGNTVMVFHGYGVSSLYAHTEDVLVRVGQKVKRGDILATVGTTGRSTSAHLHYEIIVHGVRVDPRKYILDRRL